MTNPSPILSMRNVTVSFSGIRALDLPELDIPARDGVVGVIMGPNGAGKTTLLNAISGYARINGGGVIDLYSGGRKALRQLSRAAIVRAGVVRTFQTPTVFASLTIRETMLLVGHYTERAAWYRRWKVGCASLGATGPGGALVEQLIECLGLAGVADVPMVKLPLPLIRRAELGRCLAAQPRVLLLDEPSAGADGLERTWLSQFLRIDLPELCAKLRSNGLYRHDHLTLCVVTHDLPLVRRLCGINSTTAPLLYILNQGRLLAVGLIDTILQDERVRDAYLGDG